MPHFSIQYSDNILQDHMAAFCAGIHAEIAAIGIYPLAGVRVRAIPCPIYAVADLHPKNAFVDMVFRIGAGRGADDKKETGKRLMAFAQTYFADELAAPHFALSLEILEIDPVLSWKTNSIHLRLKGRP